MPNTAKKVLEMLENQGFEAYLAGGCVRDYILRRKPEDYDVATNATPVKVSEIAKAMGYKAIPTGIDHGTVTVVIGGRPIEVTTYRKDLETDGRHAIVDFTSASLRDDAERRDFTVNAMYQDRTGNIIDLFNGQEDLNKGVLRFVGDPQARVQEDYLRILRLYRFWSKLGLIPEQKSREAVIALCDGLAQISKERITSELLNILGGINLEPALTAMQQDGVFRVILPDLSTPDSYLVAGFRHENIKLQALARLYLLFHSGSPALNVDFIASSLRLSNHDTATLELLSSFPADFSVPRDQAAAMQQIDHFESVMGAGSFLNFISPLWLHTFASEPTVAERVNHLVQIETTKGHIRTTKLPISANELMDRHGIAQGPQVGRLMRALQTSFRNELWQTKGEGFKWLELNLAHIE